MSHGNGRWLLALCIAASLAGPALAQIDVAAAKACITDRIDTGENPALCIDEAHATCQATPADSPAVAILCFRNAKADWDGAIAAEMDRIRNRADDRIAAIAAIELKYDLIASLTQCSRMEELAQVGTDTPAETIQRQKARCEASAAGLTYLRALLRGRSIK